MKRNVHNYFLIIPLFIVGCFGGGGGNSLLPGGSTTSPSLGAVKITSISPSTATAGQTLTVTGENFPTSGLSIKVGTKDCVNIVVSSSTSATCEAPKSGGVSDVTVSTADSNDKLAKVFTQSFTTTFLNKPSNNGLNYNSSRSAYTNSLLIFSNKLYAAWVETSATYSSVRVAVNDGTDDAPNWTLIDGGGALGLKVDPAKNASNVRLFTFQNKLHVVFSERNSFNSDGLQIKRYDDNSTWTTLNVGSADGLNYATNAHVNYTRCVELSDKLYCLWTEASKIRMKIYDGTSWTADGGGLNRDLTKAATIPSLLALNGKIYVSWIEANSSAVYQIRLRSYNPATTTWTKLDSDQEAGLNQDPARAPNWPNLSSVNGKLYLIWQEVNAVTSKNNVRVIAYNGDDSSPSFERLDGGGTDGIALDATTNAAQPSLGISNAQLVVHYIDIFNNKVRAAVWGGSASLSSWSHISGSAANVINYNAAAAPGYGSTYTDIPSTANHAYMGWMEMTGGNYHLRVMKLE